MTSILTRRVAGAWMVRNGRILVLQRSGGMSDGAWAPPGGNLEPGEEPLTAVLRETLEETDLTLANPAFLRSWTWQGASPIEVHHFVGVADGPMVQISHEHYDFDWLTPAQYVAKHLSSPRRDPRRRQWVEEMRVSAGLVDEWLAGGVRRQRVRYVVSSTASRARSRPRGQRHRPLRS